MPLNRGVYVGSEIISKHTDNIFLPNGVEFYGECHYLFPSGIFRLKNSKSRKTNRSM